MSVIRKTKVFRYTDLLEPTHGSKLTSLHRRAVLGQGHGVNVKGKAVAVRDGYVKNENSPVPGQAVRKISEVGHIHVRIVEEVG